MPGESQSIRFAINGKDHVVPKTFPATTSLNDYIREMADLPGTKVMCREAGCGCCSVAVTHALPDTGKVETYSVMSCITPLYLVDGWQISTVEGIGNQKKGFHPIQERIASFNGSQCGYCTPGMVMNMYGLLHQNPQPTSQEVEDSFDGNICRCTGYRPILDAMKSFCGDSTIPNARAIDIEDLNKNLCPKTGEACTNEKGGQRCLSLELGDAKWFRHGSLTEIREIINTYKDAKIRLVFGNTSTGIFKDEGPFDVYIDLHRIKELFVYERTASEVVLGAGHTLTKLLARLQANHDTPGYGYFSHLIQHVKVVASVMVRNAGCIAGNLMIKHKYPDFPSDIFTLFEAAGATLNIFDCFAGKEMTNVKLLDFLRNVDMKGKILTSVHLPKHDNNEMFRSFKITPRWQNAHAYVNAGFRMAVTGKEIVSRPSIVFGGINPQMVHAEKTEVYLTQKTLSKEVVTEALTILKGELNPDAGPLLATPKYRTDLASSLLYKVLLEISKPSDPRLRSGSDKLYRPISSGLQTYQEKTSSFPLRQPMPKKTAPLQASGEAVFVNDMPKYKNELFAVFVQAEEGNATLDSVDASEALTMPGVVSFLSAKDIPEGGANTFIAPGKIPLKPQELFATKEILHSGQPVGAIIAESREQAFAAVSKVKVNYAEVRKPILTLDDCIAAGTEADFGRKEHLVGQPDEAMKNADKVISGEIRMEGAQAHFFMETHVTVAVPSEDGIDVYSPTQYPDMCQAAAAIVLDKPLNYINVVVPRLGGGFGGKVFDTCPSNAAASLAAYITGRPVRMVYSLSNVLTTNGKRPPQLVKYKAAIGSNGVVTAIEMDYYIDIGCVSSMVIHCMHHLPMMDMGYHVANWNIHLHPMMSNRQRISPVRSPGSVHAAIAIETILEHAAKTLAMHPIRLKEINLIQPHQTDLLGHSMKDSTVRECWQRLKDLAEVEGRMRQVDGFNQANLWKKRGLTMSACKYGIAFGGGGHNVSVSIFYRDGSVVVSQGGVEMGQGLYTKVAQAVAHSLAVPLESVKVRSVQSIVSPNTHPSGGSTASEMAVQSAVDACNVLKERIQPIREKFPDLSWKDLMFKCETNRVDLSAKCRNFQPAGDPIFNYFVYCVAAVETEVDVLTGESQIRRVDVMADFGDSLNPTIDIGQIEGSIVMGLGAYLTEETILDQTTGRVLNDGTWEYKPPTTKDIPINWRIHLLPDRPNPHGILSSKAVGEPTISLAFAALLANKLAVMDARKDLFNATDYIPTVAPYSVERVQQSVCLDTEHLTV